MALFGAKKRLGEQLVDAGLLTPDKLELALQEQQTKSSTAIVTSQERLL